MNKHWVTCIVLLATLTAACNRSAQVAVHAVSSDEDGEQALAQLPVRLIPYDRDSLFEAMAARAPEPEPQPPQELIELRDSIAAAQARWREAEGAWNEAYSELKELSERMDRMNKASNEYFQAYQRFEDVEARERRLNREKEAFFNRFTELQSEYNALADSFVAVLRTWEGETFRGYGEIADSLEEAMGRTTHWDTTGTNGWAFFSVPAGTWYVHTRSKLPFEELYWNVPIQLEGGTTDTLILEQSNAELRPIY